MRSRHALVLLVWGGLTLGGGASPGQAETIDAGNDASRGADASPDSAGATAPQGGTILVLGPPLGAAHQVTSGLLDELSDRYTIASHEITAQSKVEELATILATVRAQVLVLLNNPTVRLYRAYQKTQPPGTRFPPAVILMTAFLEQATQGVQDATGISYEVPAVTALVNLRSLLGRRIRRIGVLYRSGFEAYVAGQERLAVTEGFAIVGRTLDAGNQHNAVKRGLRRLLDYDRVDALWVLDDSALLSPTLVARAWLPVLRHAHVPVLVGVPSLVSPKLGFGTFAVFPEHRALGAQAATLIDDLAERHWQIGDRRTLLPIAVEKVLNLGLARSVGLLREDKVREVDHVVGENAWEER